MFLPAILISILVFLIPILLKTKIGIVSATCTTNRTGPQVAVTHDIGPVLFPRLFVWTKNYFPYLCCIFRTGGARMLLAVLRSYPSNLPRVIPAKGCRTDRRTAASLLSVPYLPFSRTSKRKKHHNGTRTIHNA